MVHTKKITSENVRGMQASTWCVSCPICACIWSLQSRNAVYRYDTELHSRKWRDVEK